MKRISPVTSLRLQVCVIYHPPEFFSREDKHLFKAVPLPVYPVAKRLEKPDTAAEFRRLYNFNFKGHGDMIATAREPAAI